MIYLMTSIGIFAALTIGFAWSHYCDLKDEETRYY